LKPSDFGMGDIHDDGDKMLDPKADSDTLLVIGVAAPEDGFFRTLGCWTPTA